MIDFALRRKIDWEAIRRGIAEVYGVPADRVLVEAEVADAFPDPGDAEAVGLISHIPGDFPMGIVAYSLRRDHPLAGDVDPVVPARRLAAAVGVDCLVPDYSIDSYVRRIVSPDGRVERVDVDEDFLDEDCGFKVVGPASTDRGPATIPS